MNSAIYKSISKYVHETESVDQKICTICNMYPVTQLIENHYKNIHWEHFPERLESRCYNIISCFTLKDTLQNLKEFLAAHIALNPFVQ